MDKIQKQDKENGLTIKRPIASKFDFKYLTGIDFQCNAICNNACIRKSKLAANFNYTTLKEIRLYRSFFVNS